MEVDLIVEDGFVVMPETGIHKRTLAIKDGKIVGISEDAYGFQAREVIDARGKYVLPGVIQPHAHLGRLEGMRDYATETSSSVIGGVTTVLDYYRVSGDYGKGLSKTIDLIAAQSYIDFSFHFQVMSDLHLGNLSRYVHEFGVSSFKFNMGYKGEESKEKGLAELNDGLMLEGFSKLGGLKGAVACVHAENSEIIAYHTARLKGQGRDDLKAWSEARPAISEAESILRTLYFGEVTGCPVYLVHVTTREGLHLAKAHREKGGSAVYVETCPQYLTHHVENNVGKVAKFTPPLRTKADNEALWQALIRGEIDTIGIDQITRKVDPEEISIWKRSTAPREAVTTLPVLISEGFHKRGLTMERIAGVTSTHAARIFNLYPRKGALNIGSDGDAVVVDIHLEKKVTREVIRSYSEFSIYEGWTLRGWPVVTISRGKVVMRNGDVVGEPGWGSFLKRGPNT